MFLEVVCMGRQTQSSFRQLVLCLRQRTVLIGWSLKNWGRLTLRRLGKRDGISFHVSSVYNSLCSIYRRPHHQPTTIVHPVLSAVYDDILKFISAIDQIQPCPKSSADGPIRVLHDPSPTPYHPFDKREHACAAGELYLAASGRAQATP